MPTAEAENKEGELRKKAYATATVASSDIGVRRITKQEARKEAKKFRPAPSSSQSHGSKKAKLKIPWCGMFNKNNCTNIKVGKDGCKGTNGKFYLHSCDVPIDADGTKCGRYDHNARTHK